ncbi:MAG: hypothetical protein FD152_400 [Xanthobacteraceae bacterium]|nr:MAG: hypothetical protein FD152_400 [Xanthobacteraceae bacterium]
MLHRAVAVQHRLRAEIDRAIEELLDQRPEYVGLGQLRKLIAELEVVEDLLHVRREPIEEGLEISLQLGLRRAIAKIAEIEARRIVEGLSCRLAKRRVLIGDARLVEVVLHRKDGGLGRLQHRIETAQHDHRQDNITIFAAHVEIAQGIIGDAPYEVCDPVEVAVTHACFNPLRLLTVSALGLTEGAGPPALSRNRSYSSTAMTTTTGRPCFSTVTGSIRARSISRPKPSFASFADIVCMAWPLVESRPILAILDLTSRRP